MSTTTPSPYDSLSPAYRRKVDEALAECNYRYCESTRDDIAADILAVRARASAPDAYRHPATIWPDAARPTL